MKDEIKTIFESIEESVNFLDWQITGGLSNNEHIDNIKEKLEKLKTHL